MNLLRNPQGGHSSGASTWIDEYTRKHPDVPGVTFADQDPITVGGYHTTDIPCWFGTQDAYNSLRPTRDWTDWHRTLSARMMDALLALAETASPDTAATPWRPWTSSNDANLRLGNDIGIGSFEPARLTGRTVKAALL